MSLLPMAVQREDKCVQHDGVVTNPDASATDESTTALLATTVECCQQLAEKLRQKEKSCRQQLHLKNKQVPVLPNFNNSNELQPSIEENIRLKAVIQDVTEANRRWQKHNEQCQSYIERLKTTIQELREQLANAQTTPPTSQQQQPMQSAASRSVVADEVAALRLANSEMEDTIRQQRTELDECRRKMAKHVTTLEVAQSDHKEHVHLLQMQVEGYRADWEAESNEKKQLQKKVTKLQEELIEAKSKIFRLQNPERCACQIRTDIYSEPIVRTRHSSPVNYNIPADNTLIPRSSHVRHIIVCDGPEAEETECHASPPPSTTTSISPSFDCPDCGEHFPTERHVEFLKHYEHCQEKEPEAHQRQQLLMPHFAQ